MDFNDRRTIEGVKRYDAGPPIIARDVLSPTIVK
jgi:hypothetical protein